MSSVLRNCPKITYRQSPRSVLGCIQIATDFVLDFEAPYMLQKFPGVEVRLQKVHFDSEELHKDTYFRAKDNIGKAVTALLPHDRCTIMGLACTSMSYTLGPTVVDSQLRCANPSVKTTDMARSQVAALTALGVKKISLLTPYIEELSIANVDMLEKSAHVKVLRRATMGLNKDVLTSLVSDECMVEWAKAVDCPQSEAIVIGCSGFRACGNNGFIDKLEATLGKPVVTSTQAFLWNMLRLSGVQDQVTGYGRLLLHC